MFVESIPPVVFAIAFPVLVAIAFIQRIPSPVDCDGVHESLGDVFDCNSCVKLLDSLDTDNQTR